MLKLIEIHDTDDDHETGEQDLPYLVTASYIGDFQVAKDLIRADRSLNAFNIEPASSRCNQPSHIQFYTFEFDSTITKFFERFL